MTLSDNATEELRKFCRRFEMAKYEAETLAENEMGKTFEETRKRKVKRHFDEIVNDKRLEDAESRFRVEVFNGTLNIVLAKLTDRFASLRGTVADLNAIQPCTLCNSTDQVLF